MPIIQINLFICEVCGKTETDVDADVGMYSDPVVAINGWGHRKSDDKLACPDCLKK